MSEICQRCGREVDEGEDLCPDCVIKQKECLRKLDYDYYDERCMEVE